MSLSGRLGIANGQAAIWATRGLVTSSVVVASASHSYVLAALAVGSLVPLSLYRFVQPQVAANDDPITARLRREVESGRRLAIFDHETGLTAEWYLTMRVAEECQRAVRYGHPLSIVLLQTDRSPDRLANEDRLLEWMRVGKRSVDLAGYLGPGRLLLVLPDTDRAGARALIGRLRGLAEFQDQIGELPSDGATPEELYAAVERRSGPDNHANTNGAAVESRQERQRPRAA